MTLEEAVRTRIDLRTNSQRGKEKPDAGAYDSRYGWPGTKLSEFGGDFKLLATQRYLSGQLHVIVFEMIYPPNRLAVRVQDPYEKMYYLELEEGSRAKAPRTCRR